MRKRVAPKIDAPKFCYSKTNPLDPHHGQDILLRFFEDGTVSCDNIHFLPDRACHHQSLIGVFEVCLKIVPSLS